MNGAGGDMGAEAGAGAGCQRGGAVGAIGVGNCAVACDWMKSVLSALGLKAGPWVGTVGDALVAMPESDPLQSLDAGDLGCASDSLGRGAVELSPKSEFDCAAGSAPIWPRGVVGPP